MSISQDDLAYFTGTEQLWHQTLLGFKYTDGVKYVAQEGNAYWLLTDISAFQHQAAIVKYAKHDWFQTWKLRVDQDHRATLTCEDGNDHVLFSHEYLFTDFPLEEITFFLVDGILLLPSEY